MVEHLLLLRIQEHASMMEREAAGCSGVWFWGQRGCTDGHMDVWMVLGLVQVLTGMLEG